MPFPRNWLEELVAEYLELEDYFVETGHPVQIGKRGGRREIDILGTKVDSITSKPHVIHVEAGRARSKQKLQEKIKEQFFDHQVAEELEKRFGTSDCERWFVSDAYSETSQAWNQLKKTFHKSGVRLLTFGELIEEIKSSISRWKRIHRTPKGAEPMLPENLWLLKFLEKIEERKKT